MRQLKTLSYSGLSLWESRPEEFYLTRLCEPAAARAAGTAGRRRCSLRRLREIGVSRRPLRAAVPDPKYAFDALFTAQVEPHNRDWALAEGKYIFDCYVISGFYARLLDLLAASSEPPRFEFTVEAEINSVPFLGKPDARWVTPGLAKVVHDFKVNGYCGKHTVSPHKSYMLCRDGYVAEKQSKSHDTEHREFLAYRHLDLTINTTYLEAANTEWADQLSLYGWALGEKIGDETVVLSIHQIVAKPMPAGRPQLRVAEYRATVKESYQLELAARLKRCWDAIASGHVFVDLSREDSDARCQTLDEAAIGLQSDGSSRDAYFNEATRTRYMGK